MSEEQLIKDIKLTNIYNDYTEGAIIGSGTYGSVRLIYAHGTNSEFAVKNLSYIEAKHCVEIKREILYLRLCTMHPNICRLHDVYHDVESKIYHLVMTAYDHDLRSHKSKTGNRFPFFSALNQLSSGLQYLHNRFIMHRDLTCANIFVKGSVLSIGDLGMARQFTKRKTFNLTKTDNFATKPTWVLKSDDTFYPLSTNVTTRQYRAPELFFEQEDQFENDQSELGVVSNEDTCYTYGSSIDLWSLGVVLFYVAFNEYPFSISMDPPDKFYFTEEIWPFFNNSISNPCRLPEPSKRSQLVKMSSIKEPSFLRNTGNSEISDMEFVNEVLGSLLCLNPLDRPTVSKLRELYVDDLTLDV